LVKQDFVVNLSPESLTTPTNPISETIDVLIGGIVSITGCVEFVVPTFLTESAHSWPEHPVGGPFQILKKSCKFAHQTMLA